MKTPKFIERVFQDNTGKYISGQPPNIPIVIIIVGIIGQVVSPKDSIFADFFGLIVFGAIFLWAYLEIVYGESLFRRILGSAVLVLLFVTRLQ